MYPDLPQHPDSRKINISGITVGRAMSGSLRKRITFAATKHEFNITHEVNTNDRDVLLAHYEQTKNLTFDFIWHGDNQTYIVTYVAPPDVQYIGYNWWRVTNVMAEM